LFAHTEDEAFDTSQHVNIDDTFSALRVRVRSEGDAATPMHADVRDALLVCCHALRRLHLQVPLTLLSARHTHDREPFDKIVLNVYGAYGCVRFGVGVTLRSHHVCVRARCSLLSERLSCASSVSTLTAALYGRTAHAYAHVRGGGALCACAVCGRVVECAMCLL
jgi:hypothetical protein